MITLIDQSLKPIMLTLWNAEAQIFDFKRKDSIIIIQNDQLNEINGRKTISNIAETNLIFDPDTQDAQIMRDWYQKNGKEEVIEFLAKLSSKGF